MTENDCRDDVRLRYDVLGKARCDLQGNSRVAVVVGPPRSGVSSGVHRHPGEGRDLVMAQAPRRTVGTTA